MSAAETQVRRNIREDAAWRPGGATRTQCYRSSLCDAHALDILLEHSAQLDPISLELYQVPELQLGNSPLFDGDADLVRTASQHRLRIKYCPLCGHVFDRFCDHAAVCPCSRDHKLRHHAIALVLYEAAQEAGLHPQIHIGPAMTGPTTPLVR